MTRERVTCQSGRVRECDDAGDDYTSPPEVVKSGNRAVEVAPDRKETPPRALVRHGRIC